MPAEHKKVEKPHPPATVDIEQPHVNHADHLNSPLPVPGVPPKPDQVRRLQRVIGNQAVIRLMKAGNRLSRKKPKRAPDSELQDEISPEGMFETAESEHEPDI